MHRFAKRLVEVIATSVPRELSDEQLVCLRVLATATFQHGRDGHQGSAATVRSRNLPTIDPRLMAAMCTSCDEKVPFRKLLQSGGGFR